MPAKPADHLSAARSILALVAWLALSLTAAAMGRLFLPGEWYAALWKPAWNPPNWIFGPVRAVLYTAMAVAALCPARCAGCYRPLPSLCCSP